MPLKTLEEEKAEQGESTDYQNPTYIEGHHAPAVSKSMHGGGFAVMANNAEWTKAFEQNTVRQGGAETDYHAVPVFPGDAPWSSGPKSHEYHAMAGLYI